MTPYSKLFYTWVVLLAATLLSATLHLQTVVILAIALIKCRLVIRTYMEVRHAPGWLRHSCDGWLLLNGVMLSSYYWL